ncbi:MAG: AAA family ATPase [Saprospiraceae bacterium]|nr:AAA family ATPase [Saprospiraceae bacterium]
MKNVELSRLFYTEILKIYRSEALDSKAKIQALYQLLHTIFMNVTMAERVPFNTFFARMAYSFQKYEVPMRRQMIIHQFRKTLQHYDYQKDIKEIFDLGLRACADAVKIFYGEDPSVDLLNILPPREYFTFVSTEIFSKKAEMCIVVLSDDAANEQFVCVDEETGEQVRMQYFIAERNENFRKSVAVIRHIFGFPTTLRLLDVEVSKEGVLRPKAFVIEPDYLVDVTAIAESFRHDSAEPLTYFLTKFLPYEASVPIMKGNIANFFLDELVANPEVTFAEIFPKVFKINPIAFCVFDDREVRQIFEDCKGHFVHLKRVVTEGFAQTGIKRENCYLEPSFYAPKYGLQGRLDLFYQNPESGKSAIVELKSGKPFKPNIYGISNNHFTQTLLYDLLVEAAFGNKIKPLCYILYSVLEQENLKYAPHLTAQQFEALNIRNQILSLEQALINLNKKNNTAQENNVGEGGDFFKRIISKLLLTAQGFEKREIELFAKTYNNLSDIEKKYFTVFSSFIAREHQISKIGQDGIEKANGVASLWLDKFEDKEQNFAVFSHLQIIDNQSFSPDALIVFQKTEQTNALANFRIGDIIVLYPKMSNDTEGGILRNQIFKCSLVAMTKETITVRLRSRQLNQYIFEAHEFWNIEHDLLDSSYNSMFRGLFEFAKSSKHKRNLLLTVEPPTKPISQDVSYIDEMTTEQNHILQKILASQDYFLLWGPPGTGKTSVMLKHLVGHLLSNTNENILLLAYTNRAVDEICEAIESLGSWVKDEYVRIGSRYGTSPVYHEQLLDRKIDNINTRKQLVEVIKRHRIFVATVASISGKLDLMKLTDFHRVIIDEASQILEPQLVGLLPFFNHFTLIGDHKQLPAVVQQSEDESLTDIVGLHQIGLKNLRNSFFERLYKRAITEGWTWAYDVLSHQGRMHLDIMQFPSAYFYEQKLKVLPEGMNGFQLQHIDFQSENFDSDFEKIVTERRVLFINSEPDLSNSFNKTNVHEAQLIGQMVKVFEKMYASKNQKLHPLSIGVITPYRAQIAQIQAVLRDLDFDIDKITIDTVERYQGGAREVILISLCTNQESQLASLVSLSEEGVDRKLNVALTRARKHLVVIGNKAILKKSTIYHEFIEKYEV